MDNEIGSVEVVISSDGVVVDVNALVADPDPRVGRIYYVRQPKKPVMDEETLAGSEGEVGVAKNLPKEGLESPEKSLKKVSLEEYKRRRRVTVDANENEGESPVHSPSHQLVICEEGNEDIIIINY